MTFRRCRRLRRKQFNQAIRVVWLLHIVNRTPHKRYCHRRGIFLLGAQNTSRRDKRAG